MRGMLGLLCAAGQSRPAQAAGRCYPCSSQLLTTRTSATQRRAAPGAVRVRQSAACFSFGAGPLCMHSCLYPPALLPITSTPTQRALALALRRLRVFSVEMGAQGRRRFLVTSYPQLWRRYRDMLPQHRHFYEIVRQGWPCHLYFGGLATLSWGTGVQCGPARGDRMV